MYSFVNDYSETAHPAVMAAIAATATVDPASACASQLQYPGYGCDNTHCGRAAALIREHIGKSESEVDIHFFVSGTITNTVAITGLLRPWEAVISTHLGHINVHETGAIEAAGHKVLVTHADDGKLTPALVDDVLHQHSSEHMVVPRMVYISNTTEIGTQYTKRELEELSSYCRAHDLFLFLDGARLGSALMSSINDLTMKDVADLTDAFYIGGTKNGAMFGEALVVSVPSLKPFLRHLIKQRGGLMAKGWLIGVQFEALFTDKLFYTAASHANRMSMILKCGVKECGYRLVGDSYTNQLFVIFPAALVARLQDKFLVSIQEKRADGQLLVRLCTSWATSEEQCHRFTKELKTSAAGNGRS